MRLFNGALSQKKASWVSTILITFLVLPCVSRAEANQQTSVDKRVKDLIKQDVQLFLEDWPQAKYTIAIRDDSKKIKACEKPENFSRMATSRPPIGTIRVNMDCANGYRSYRIADVAVTIPVVVSRGNLMRAQSLKISDLKKIDVPWKKLRGQFYTDIHMLVGRTLNRSINNGKVIESRYLLPQYLIKKGESVTIQASKAGLQISMMGTALESGELKHRIQVRNRSSGKVIDALITAKGKVEAIF
ncbi:MAG: flagellar basal body P-ring formation chaperone FlgA [Endozoicomonas sp. (ex Botrylloides leachii)]|nr:flagellar basal body P-ring formation chaperone FlgA [Endozoicomonas sp. (ex Botrylloides leachii)]